MSTETLGRLGRLETQVYILQEVGTLPTIRSGRETWESSTSSSLPSLPDNKKGRESSKILSGKDLRFKSPKSPKSPDGIGTSGDLTRSSRTQEWQKR